MLAAVFRVSSLRDIVWAWARGLVGGGRTRAQRAEDQTRGVGAPGPTRKQRSEADEWLLSVVTHPHHVTGWVT